jgi:hypothetical protein
MAWSEPLFVCEVLLYLLWAVRWMEGRNTRMLMLMALAAALACMTRYLGVSLVLGGIGLILLAPISRIRTRIFSLALFSLLSLAPLIAWLIRNQLLAGSFFGERAQSSSSLWDNLTFFLHGCYFWFLPDGLFDSRSVTIALSIVFLLLSVWLWIFVRSRASNEERRDIADRFQKLLPILLFVGCYAATLLVTSTISTFDRIGVRLLSPIYIPVCLAIMMLLKPVLTIISRCFSAPWIGKGVRKSALLLALLGAAMIIAVAAYRIRSGAGGYASADWQNSETIRYLKAQDSWGDFPIFSNAPDAIYILTSRTAYMSPAKPLKDDPDPAQIQLQKPWPPSPGAILVWFKPIQHRYYLQTVDELTAFADLTPLLHYSDADVYRVTAK